MLVKHLCIILASYSILSVLWLTVRLSLIPKHSLCHSLDHLFTLSRSLNLSPFSDFSSLLLTFSPSPSINASLTSSLVLAIDKTPTKGLATTQGQKSNFPVMSLLEFLALVFSLKLLTSSISIGS